jgi:hypothetical protein
VRVPTLGSPKPSHPQIALTADGRVVIAWDESLDGVRRAAVSVMSNGNGGGAAFSTPVQVEPSNSTSPAAAVYPALATTPRQILVAWTSGSGESTIIGVRRLPSTMTLSSR